VLPQMALFSVLGAAVACSSNAADQVTQPRAVGMTACDADAGNCTPTPPYYSDGNLTLYEVQIPVQLPVRRPTSAERSALGGAPKNTPYSHMPFLLASDESVEIHYVISNIDSTQHTVWLLLDPWNEFVRYRPGVTVVDDDTTVPNESFEPGGPGFLMDPKSRIEGTVTPDDMHELAIRLAATENYLMSPAALAAENPDASGGDNSLSPTEIANHIFNQQNFSTTNDPLFTPYVPPIIAGITGFDLGLRTLEPANMAVEITINAQDLNGNRLVAQDTTAQTIGLPPATLAPPGARY
jgi:hypothetical protein